MVRETISYKLVRRILKTHTDKEVTHEGVIYVRDFLDRMLLDIALESTIKVDELNKYRGYQNQPELKRIPVSIFLSVLAQLLKQPTDFNNGELGEINSKTNLSKAREYA